MPPIRRPLLPAAVLLAGIAFACVDARAHVPPPSAAGTLQAHDGVALAWASLGHGPDTVVVVHGGPALPHDYLRGPLAPLGDAHTFVFYDMRSRGRSASPADTSGETFEADVADLAAVLDHFGLARTALVGHHYGAAVVAHLAAREPSRVTRAVLLAPFFAAPQFIYEVGLDGVADTAPLRAAGEARRAGMDTLDPVAWCRQRWGLELAPAHVLDAASVRAVAPALCEQPAAQLRGRVALKLRVQRSLGSWSWIGAFDSVTAPVLVIGGSAGPGMARSDSAWARLVPGARLLVSSGAAVVPWLRDPDGVRTALRVFLAGDWPANSDVVPTPTP